MSYDKIRRVVSILLIGLSIIIIDLPQSSIFPEYQQPDNSRSITSHEENREGKDGKTFWQRTTDDPIAFFTLLLTLFTAVLAVSTIGLWIVTWRGAKKQAADMQESLRISRDAANATEKAASAALKSANALIKADRAHIFVDDIVFDLPTKNKMPYELPRIVKVNVTFVNNGRTAAIIREVNGNVFFSVKMPEIPPYDSENCLVEDFTLKNEIKSIPFTYMLKQAINIEDQTLHKNREKFIFCFGFVRYEDIFGSEYVRGFCFVYSRRLSRFTPYGDKEYNYDKPSYETVAGTYSPPVGVLAT
jgi:hypothetical protein